jgi:hypothetical protein
MRSSWARWNMRRLASVKGNREVATACGMEGWGQKGVTLLQQYKRVSPLFLQMCPPPAQQISSSKCMDVPPSSLPTANTPGCPGLASCPLVGPGWRNRTKKLGKGLRSLCTLACQRKDPCMGGREGLLDAETGSWTHLRTGSP